jgi:hypothetical protein
MSPMLLAYIDPGSGGFLLQLLLAGVMAFAFNLSQLPQKLARVWRRIFGGAKPSDGIASDTIK